MRRLVLASLIVVTGCGGSDPPRAAAPPARTPTVSPAPTATASAAPAGDPRAQAELKDFLEHNTQDGGRICVPAGEVPDPAIAAVECDYDGSSDGSWLLFKTRGAMRSYYNRVAATAKPIKGGECSSYSVWSRGRRQEGRLRFGRVGSGKLLVWTDDSERVVGAIRADDATNAEMCAIWRTRT